MRIIALAACLALQAQTQSAKLTAQQDALLAARMKRSQEIYEYERLAWLATDRLMEKKPDQSALGMWVEVPTDGRRFIFFGRFKNELDPKDKPDGFAVVYGFWAPIGNPSDVHEMDMEKEIRNTPKLFQELPELADAAALARKQPSSLNMGWNYSVFREEDRTITAYLLPANSENGIVPIGGDFRVSISPDGKKVLNTTTLHRSFLKMPTEPPPNADKSKPVGGFHTHTLQEDFPPETDVAVLKLYSSKGPHYMATRIGLFCFADNTMYYLGTLEDKKK
ncbi:hypothetical protein [Geothrix sp. PMB-07]|uniref:hypothetical protein n=1 Tax=Geothrix sp. PMB-07 TaxID=3068640 RepID=UPI002741E6E7|nr:hypothetical protein [Geothrix sp. PMB-07]WLT32326.1 hypothetical protein Q9293_03130 [Geothrix sp. PMB-07]